MYGNPLNASQISLTIPNNRVVLEKKLVDKMLVLELPEPASLPSFENASEREAAEEGEDRRARFPFHDCTRVLLLPLLTRLVGTEANTGADTVARWSLECAAGFVSVVTFLERLSFLLE
jgi:hypothetical protein